MISGSLLNCIAIKTDEGLVIHPVADSDFAPVVGARQVTLLPAEIGIADLDAYESQYVQLSGVQPVAAYRGKPWYSGSEPESMVKFEIETGAKFNVVIGKSAIWASSNIIPAKRGSIRGIVVRDKAGNIQVAPRNKKDVDSLTEETFIYTITSIASIAEEGRYAVGNAIVLASDAGGFIIEDATGRMYVDQHLSDVAADLPNVGAEVTVRGTVMMKNGLFCYQAEGLEIEVIGEGTLPELVLQGLKGSEISTLFAKPVISYVKYTGELSKVAGNYRITVTGTDVVGSLVHPLEVGKLEALVGKLVDVTGWTIGSHDTATTKLLMTLAVHVEEHTASPEGKFTTEPKAFAGINPEPQTLSFNTNHAAGEVRFTIVPDDGRFIAHKLSATEVEVITQGYISPESP